MFCSIEERTDTCLNVASLMHIVRISYSLLQQLHSFFYNFCTIFSNFLINFPHFFPKFVTQSFRQIFPHFSKKNPQFFSNFCTILHNLFHNFVDKFFYNFFQNFSQFFPQICMVVSLHLLVIKKAVKLQLQSR